MALVACGDAMEASSLIWFCVCRAMDAWKVWEDEAMEVSFITERIAVLRRFYGFMAQP